MAVLGLDTTVVIRLLVGQPAAQFAVARRRLARAVDAGDTVLVSDVVAAEAYFALQHHYEVPKAEARTLLRQFLHSGTVQLDPKGGLEAFDEAPGAGLVDRLIHGRYRSLGASTLTFERKQGGLPGAERLRES
jgi:predicted nucleic acid-binding protein